MENIIGILVIAFIVVAGFFYAKKTKSAASSKPGAGSGAKPKDSKGSDKQ